MTLFVSLLTTFKEVQKNGLRLKLKNNKKVSLISACPNPRYAAYVYQRFGQV